MISKSRFLGFCLPVSGEQEAQEALAQLRKAHYDARHCCYAFRLTDGTARSSDDGEPSGTAGAPILSVLAGAGVENALCAVVRYFGGVLLGTGGLVRAYGKTASEAVAHAGTLSYRICRLMRILVSYPSYAVLEPLTKALAYPCEAEFSDTVTLHCTIPVEECERFCRTVTDKTDGAAKLELLEQTLCAV